MNKVWYGYPELILCWLFNHLFQILFSHAFWWMHFLFYKKLKFLIFSGIERVALCKKSQHLPVQDILPWSRKDLKTTVAYLKVPRKVTVIELRLSQNLMSHSGDIKFKKISDLKMASIVAVYWWHTQCSMYSSTTFAFLQKTTLTDNETK